MDPKNKFKFKTYLIYLFLEPWTTKFHLPNLRTFVWVLIVISFLLKKPVLLFISIGVGILLYAINEYKSGKYIYWYRQRKYGEQREALRKIKEERRNGK